MFNHAVKVENTVAMMQLTRQALSGLGIVPRVFAWSETGEPSGTGWILEEYMPGVDIESKYFTDVPREAQRFVFSQMATILKAVQDFELPPKASGFGGLAFDDSGAVISGPFAVEPYNGPYPDMDSMYKGMLQAQLVEADRSRVAQGWKEDGLRDRLDAFAERGLENILARSLPEHVRPNLIIGDVDDTNATGSFEFEAQAESEAEFFPMSVRFAKTRPYVDVDVSSVTLLNMGQDVSFSKDIKSVADGYLVV
ncbi:hypothetical protein D6C83_06644 [Aureobasidium pullulans]|uniref:Coatomer subunit delta n=1 Tax=Aureobasidium pullulans TaxID=5580 RepID=A0A4T0BNJ5_AURPU|nr:hypothetical protein D6C83_06644 [Aureobasidium pullulans]